MTVRELIAELRGLDGGVEVLVNDGSAEYDVVLDVHRDEDGRVVVVIDLTADCSRD